MSTTGKADENDLNWESLNSLIEGLSGREKQILGLASSGLTDAEIAANLRITARTLRGYWIRIRRFCGTKAIPNLTEAFVRAALEQFRPEIADLSSDIESLALIEGKDIRKVAAKYSTSLHRAQQSQWCSDRASRVIGQIPRLATANTESELLESACRILVDEGGFVMAWIGVAQTDREQTVEAVASYGDSLGYLDHIAVSWGENPLGRGPVGMALRLGKTQVTRDVLADPKVLPWRAEATKNGFQSAAALPLLIGASVLAVLAVYAVEPDSFDSSELGLLEAFSADVAARLSEIRQGARL